MANESLIVGNSNWAVKANNLLGYAVGETSGYYVPRELDFTRNSTATYTDENGIIQTASANIARVQDNALLLEPQRTNIMLNSEALNSWLKIDTSVASDTTISPDGTQNADTVTATGSGSLSHLIYQNLAFTSGTAYTMSVFAKANTSDYIQLVLAGNLIANSYANFDLSNGTITASAFVTAKIEDYGNGWYRCSVSATAGTSATNSQILYLINSPTASRGQSFNASGESVYLWGGQFEAGAYATSYIKTTNATATRLADSCSKTGISSLIGQTEGTLFVEIELPNPSEGGSSAVVQLGGPAPRIYVAKESSTSNIFQMGMQNSSFRYNFVNTSEISTPTIKFAIGYASANNAFFVNGSLVSTASANTNPSGLSTINLPMDPTKHQFKIKQVLLFPTRLSNAELAQMTTL